MKRSDRLGEAMCNSKNQKGKKYQENNFKTTKNPTPAKQRQITKLKVAKVFK